jgi:hypothetical protein
VIAAQVTAAAAGPVLPLVHGPLHGGSVLGVFTRAVIIGVRTAAGPRVLSLLAPAAAGVPNGVRLAAVNAGLMARPTPGDAVLVGAGRILLGGLDVRVVRSWPCRVRRFAVDRRSIDAISDTAGMQASGVPDGVVAALESALESTQQSALESAQQSTQQSAGHHPGMSTPPATGRPLQTAVGDLVGRGLGLTPGGDDVIAGALCGLHAAGATGLVSAVAAAALTDLTDRTTLLSADLLRLAADGDACVEVLGVLRAAHHARDRLRLGDCALGGALDRLLAVGHTSGADLATGLAVGLRVGAARATRERSEVR